MSWPGVEIGADLTASLIVTECAEDDITCSSASLWTGILADFVVANPDFDPSTLSTEEFSHLLAKSATMWRSKLGAANPRLHFFQEAGGNLVIWHGMADTTIPPKGTEKYFNDVLKHNDNVLDLFRYFEVPGIGHGSGGRGPLPNDALKQLMAWVENKTAPLALEASLAKTGLHRPLCPYPSRQIYLGGDVNETASFACVPRIYKREFSAGLSFVADRSVRRACSRMES